MRHLTWSRLLAVGALAAPTAGRAQDAKPQVPPAGVRELATIEGNVTGFVRLPSGRALIYTVQDSTFSYEIATKHRTLLGTDMSPESVSPQGDRFAFSRSAEDRTGAFLWTMPIDPGTGVATGPAHQVSLRPTDDERARFSPDGKLIAFNAGPRPDGTWDVSLVPATGGAERVVANYPRPMIVGWMADGQSLFIEGGSPQVIPIAGGRRESLFSRTPVTGHWLVGLSPDARIALFQDNPDRFYYRTASGVEGAIPVDLPPLDDGWGLDFSLQSMRYATMTLVHHTAVRIVDMATGQSHDLLPGNMPTSAPAWSPDGRRIAVLLGNLSHYQIGIMNADGSGLRRYPLPKQLDGWGRPWTQPWSPDGRFLAFLARDRRKVGWNDSESQLVLLDVNAGTTRVLADVSPESIQDFVWRSDGKAIRAIEHVRDAQTGEKRPNIVEIGVNGATRPLRGISAEFPGRLQARFTSDRELVVGVGADPTIRRFLVPVDGGTARPLPDVVAESGVNRGGGVGLPLGGPWVVVPRQDARGDWPVVTFLSTTGDSTVTMRLPFGSTWAQALPNGKYVVLGHAAGDTLNRIYVVGLDGSKPRLIGDAPRWRVSATAPSPDGKLLAYTSEGRPTTSIFEIDFGPVLQALMKR
jgi:Tol biopolymer transport system component